MLALYMGLAIKSNFLVLPPQKQKFFLDVWLLWELIEFCRYYDHSSVRWFLKYVN
jgi:hypothetical protein